MNKILYTIFEAMSKDSYDEICKYVGIDKVEEWIHGARCTWAMTVHHAVGISRQRNIGYRPSRVNIMEQGLSTPDPSLKPYTPLYKERSRNNYTLHTPSG